MLDDWKKIEYITIKNRAFYLSVIGFRISTLHVVFIFLSMED